MGTTLRVRVGDRWYRVEVVDVDANPAKVLVDGDPVEVDLDVEPDGRTGPAAETVAAGPEHPPAAQPPQARRPVSGTPSTSARVFSTPMPGVIVSVAVKVGDQVVTGDEVCVLEAMKMQQTLRADWTGIVSAVHVQAGQQVQDGDPIAELG